MPKGDWEVSLSGNLFNEKDLDFYLEVLSLVQRRGFNRFIEKVHVASYGEDPREPERFLDPIKVFSGIAAGGTQKPVATSNEPEQW